MNESPQLMTVNDIAALAQISTETIRRWVRQGRFPKPRKIGRASRWPREQVEEILRNGLKDA